MTVPPESPCIASEMKNLRTERLWSYADRGKATYSGKNPDLLPLWAQHIVYGGSRDLIPGPISVGFAVDEVVSRQIFCSISLVFLCQYHPVLVPHASSMSTADMRILLTTVTAVFG